MPAEHNNASSEQKEYWQEFLQLRIDACYIRDYRNGFNHWVTGIATIRSIAASGSIAVWAVWQKHAIVWAAIIAASQLVDALKSVFPFAKRRRSLSAWLRQLDRLFVLAQRDWADIAGGRRTNAQIRTLLHALRTKKQQLEAKYAPDGLPRRQREFEAAESEALRYFASRYNSREVEGELDAESPDR